MILRIFYSFHKNNYRFRVQRDSISFNSLIHEYHYNMFPNYYAKKPWYLQKKNNTILWIFKFSTQKSYQTKKHNLTRTYKILKIIYPTDFCNSQLPPNYRYANVAY